MTERQQFINDIVTIYNQHGDMKNEKMKPLLIKKHPKYNTMEWGDKFRNSIQTAKDRSLIKNNGTRRLVVEHKRASSGEWGKL